jgi:hypothetical protein
VDDALMPARAAASNSTPAVFHGCLVRDVAMGEPHPVGAVQGVRAREVAGQGVGIGEAERAHVDVGACRGTAGMTGQRAHRVAVGAQLPGDGRARVTERASYDIGLHGWTTRFITAS